MREREVGAETSNSVLGDLGNQTNHFKQRPSDVGVMVPGSGRESNLPQATQLVRDTVRFWTQPSVSRVSTLKPNKHTNILLWFLTLEGQWVLFIHLFIWLCPILAASCGIFHCGAWTLRWWCTGLTALRHVFSFPTRDWTLYPALQGRFFTTRPPGKSPRASTLNHPTASNTVHGPMGCQCCLWKGKPWLSLMSSTISEAAALLNSCSTNTTKWRWEDQAGGSSSLEVPISVPISHQGNRRKPRSSLWGNSETMEVTHEELLTRGMLTSDTYNNILAVRNLSVVSDFKCLIPRVSKKILDITTNYMKSSSLFPPPCCIWVAESRDRHLQILRRRLGITLTHGLNWVCPLAKTIPRVPLNITNFGRLPDHKQDLNREGLHFFTLY